MATGISGVRPITGAQTRPLRQRVLRPDQPASASIYPDDGGVNTLHLGAFVDGELVGVASLFREPPPGSDGPKAWRLRGMATAPEVRGQGHGGALLEACIRHVAKKGGTTLWCNGRVTVAGFYQRYGFELCGEPFELPGIGPHYLMRRAVARRDAGE